MSRADKLSNEKAIEYEITRHIAVLSESTTGWKKELNLVSWNGNSEKYDIRDWSPDHSRMSRGITLKTSEMNLIVEAIMNDPTPF